MDPPRHSTPGPAAPPGPRRRFYYGWVILAVGVIGTFIFSPGQTYVVSVFVDPIQQETGWSRTLIAGLYTLGSLTAATAMFLIGRLMDRYGARVMLTAVGVLFGLAALWMSQAGHPVQFYVGFALLRILGQGSLTLLPSTMVALWFTRLRGRALSITALGSVLGQATFPPLIHLAIDRTDWRMAWIMLAAVIWIVLLPPRCCWCAARPSRWAC